MASEDWLTVQEVAREFRIQPRTVRNLVNAGRLRAVAVGGGAIKERLRFRRADVDEWIKEQTVGRR
jgi:excisionase family DNA binding protein